LAGFIQVYQGTRLTRNTHSLRGKRDGRAGEDWTHFIILKQNSGRGLVTHTYTVQASGSAVGKKWYMNQKGQCHVVTTNARW